MKETNIRLVYIGNSSREAGSRQRRDRDGYHDKSPIIKDRVPYDQRRDNGDPDLTRLKRQVLEGLSELRIDMEPSIHLLDGGQDFISEAAITRKHRKFSQLGANAL